MTIDEIKIKVKTSGEAWAIVNDDLSGPAWVIGTTERGTRDRFIAMRDSMGIDPENNAFRAVEITPESALAVLDGDPDAWDLNNVAE